MSYSLGSAQGRIDLSYTGSSAVRRAQADVGKLQGALGAAGVSMGMLGKMAAIGVGGAVVAGLAVAVKTAADFEKQISNINAVANATPEQLEAIREKALQLGADTAFSASEAANAMEELVKAGLSVEDVMGGAADAAVALAAAGGIGIPEAATIASNAMNQFNLTAAELPGVVDDIAGAANASAIDVGDLGMSISQVGAVANLAGMTFKDTATAIALMGNAGIKGSDAGTSLKTMLQNLQPQTEKQIGLFKRLGIVTEDGKNRFFDAEGNVKSFAGVSGVLSDALQGMTREQKIATLEIMFGTDAIRAAAIAADAGSEGVREMTREMGKMTAADVAAKRMDNLAGSLDQLGGSFETAFIRGGSGLLVAVRSIVDGLTDGVNAATEFGSSLGERLGPGMDDLVAAGGHVLDMLANLWDMFDVGGGAIAKLGLDIFVTTFNVVATVIETVTGLLVGHEEAIIMVAGAWLILANGGLVRVIAQLGWLAAYGLVRALDGLMALQAGATATGTALSGLAARALAAAAALGAVAALTSVVFAWMAYKKAVNEVHDAVDSVTKAIKGDSLQALEEQRQAVQDLRSEYEDLQLEEGLGATEAALKSVGKAGKALFTLDFESLGKMMNMEDGLKETEAAIDAADKRMREMGSSVLALSEGVGDIDRDKMLELLEGIENADPDALQELDAMWAGYKTTLAGVGVTQDEVVSAWRNGGSEMQGIIGALEAARTNFGRTAVASENAASAVSNFGDESMTTAQAADTLKAALDELIGVELNADQATINWFNGLKDLRKQIKETGGAIRGHSKAALDNRQVIINSTSDLLSRVDAEARAGASAKFLTRMLKNGRQAIIDNAVAAGANRKEVENLIKTYNLTPKEIRTLVEAAGADKSKNQMEELINQYRLTPKEVRSIVEAAGADTAAAKVKALRDYIAQLKDKKVSISLYETTYVKRVGKNDRMMPNSSGANGGLSHRPDGSEWGLESYASGGIRNMSAGIYHGRRIMFAEPGTGGEAFIPLADHKRKRSEALLSQVASMFGGAFIKFADGGFLDIASAVSRSKSLTGKGSDTSIRVAATAPSRDSSRSNALRLIEGKLGFDESGDAFLRGVVEEVVDDTLHYDDVIGRMN